MICIQEGNEYEVGKKGSDEDFQSLFLEGIDPFWLEITKFYHNKIIQIEQKMNSQEALFYE